MDHAALVASAAASDLAKRLRLDIAAPRKQSRLFDGPIGRHFDLAASHLERAAEYLEMPAPKVTRVKMPGDVSF